MDRLKEIKERAEKAKLLCSLGGPYDPGGDIPYLLARIERLEGALRKISCEKPKRKPDNPTEYSGYTPEDALCLGNEQARWEFGEIAGEALKEKS